jgi:pilus assembly protein CpaE
MTAAHATLLWVTPGSSESQALVEITARECGLAAHFCTYAALLERLGTERHELVGVEFGTDPKSALALLRELVKRWPGVTAFAASRDTTVPMTQVAIEAGASDVLKLPLEREDLHKALIKLRRTASRNPKVSSGAGTIITVCGARGGLGTTTLAVNLAARVAALSGSDAGLLDLDLQRGDVAAFLNVTPLSSLAAFAASGRQTDEAFLRSTLCRHPAGICVLAAPPEIEEADRVGHEEVQLALRLLREQFSYTLVDTARTITGATLAALEVSTRVLVLSDLSVPGLRSARRLLDLLGRLNLPPERAEVLITRAVAGPVSLDDAVRALGKKPVLVVPRDESAASNAMNGGTPLNSRPGPLGDAIRELATTLVGAGDARSSGARQMLRRIFTRGRAHT